MDAKDLMKELADRIQQTANVRAVFGEPLHEAGTTIIPVSRVSVRGGGGGGSGDVPAGETATGRPGQGSGMGIGLNVSTSAVGYIRVTPEGSVFVPIVDRNRIIMGAFVVAGLALFVIKTGMKRARK